MTKRNEIVEIIGKEFLIENIENGEFSYQKALNESFSDRFDNVKIKSSFDNRYYKNLDLRFTDNQSKVTVLVETKQNFDNNLNKALEQLNAYVQYEKELTGNSIIAILANTNDDRIKVYKDNIIDDNFLSRETKLRSFAEYIELINPQKLNNREEVMKNTYELNNILHANGVKEKLRGQFVGTCLIAIKHNLIFNNLTTEQIIAGIKVILTNLLDKNLNKSEKITILDKKVLDSQCIRELKDNIFQHILIFIQNKIYPFINEKSTRGQDLLNLFFTTFNKYVGKSDKNQAFTPDHIVSFMCKVIGVNKNNKILDPCCGSGSFLVRALTEELDDCDNEQEKEKVKKENIYGIEYEDTAFGLATTNMLLHGDGNSNVYQASCFEKLKEISKWNIDRVLMNPPYNATKQYLPISYTSTWKKDTKEDPSKGFYYVYEIAKTIKKGKLAVLLPMQCAIGSSKEIIKYKELMLQEHHLDAVFSLPSDIFHPGANANTCCMIFDLGIKHEKAHIKETFFGYFKDDGFMKRKNLGRVEKKENIWQEKINLWLDLYFRRKEHLGLSVFKKVTYKDEWLAEAYMETDYSQLSENNFINNIRDFLAYKFESKQNINIISNTTSTKSTTLQINNWKKFPLSQVFDEFVATKGTTTDALIEGNDIPYIAATNKLNGLSNMCSIENDDFVSKGNCLVIIQIGAGAAGYSTYQNIDFIGMRGKTLCAYSKYLNKFSGIFIRTILDMERPRYCFGRSWTGSRLFNTEILLPQDSKGNPDWQFMEDYIKSLPYGDCL